jgi:hypothetical protein
MKNLVRTFVPYASLLLLLVWLPANADTRPPAEKTRLSEPLKTCHKGCAGEKDNESREACMIQCKQADKRASASSSAKTK